MNDRIGANADLRIPHLRLRWTLCRLKALLGHIEELYTLRTEDHRVLTASRDTERQDDITFANLKREYLQQLIHASADAQQHLSEIERLELPILVCLSDIASVTRWLEFARHSVVSTSPIDTDALWHVHEIEAQHSLGILVVLSTLKKWTISLESVIGAVPRVFIASSVEGVSIADGIAADLETFELRVAHWNRGEVFVLTSTFIESLERTVQTHDFGVFVFTPDDKRLSRGQEGYVARDNVVFEFGMFVGIAGRLGAFVVAPKNFVTPSDMGGLVFAEFDSPNGGLAGLEAVTAKLLSSFNRALPDNCQRPSLAGGNSA